MALPGKDQSYIVKRACVEDNGVWKTNFMELTKDKDGNLVHPTTKPTNCDVPEDPVPDLGSFKGYTNKYTMSNVGGDLEEDYPDVAFSNESKTMNGWTGSARAGLIIGFVTFALGIIFTLIMITIDMRKRLAMYEEHIQDDL